MVMPVVAMVVMSVMTVVMMPVMTVVVMPMVTAVVVRLIGDGAGDGFVDEREVGDRYGFHRASETT